MSLRIGGSLATLVCLSSFHAVVSAGGNGPPGVEYLIAEIARNEEVVQNINAKFVVTIPEEGVTFGRFEWGYSHGREYIEGTLYLNIADIAKGVPHPFKTTFDGEIMRLYRYDPLPKRSTGRHTGRVTSLEPESFTGFPTLNGLLGHYVNPSGRVTVAEALRQAREARVQPSMQDVDGHQCYVVEAVEIYKSVGPGLDGGDVRLWIDPDRNYRILKLEMYDSKPPPMRWKEIYRRVDNIKLQQIRGVWIPTEGESHSLLVEKVPKPGVSAEEVEKMEPEKAVSYVDYRVVPMLPMKRITVDANTVAFGEEIPAEKFTIQWPDGTDVWDDFAQMSYRTGSRGMRGLELPNMDGSADNSPRTSLGAMNDRVGPEANEATHSDRSTLGMSESADRRFPPIFTLALGLLCSVGVIYLLLCRYRGARRV